MFRAALFSLAFFAMNVLAANDALNVNPPVANADLTTHGSDFLFAIFAVMLASALGVTVWTFFVPAGHRAFHAIGIAILFTASIAYFSMASDLGATPVYVEFVRYRDDLYTGNLNPYTRSIWYARYIDWVVTTPLLLLELLLATGMPLSGIFMTIFFDEVMIIGGLIGALVSSSYKWGYFTGGCIAMFYVFWALVFPARANAKAISAEAHTAYVRSAGVLAILWLLYPIAWGCADGGNLITTDSEMVFYGVLDVLAKPVFLFFHLFALKKVPYDQFNLQSGHYSAYANVATNNNAVSNEKPQKTMNAAHGINSSAPIAHGAPSTGTNPGQMHVVGGARPSDVTAV